MGSSGQLSYFLQVLTHKRIFAELMAKHTGQVSINALLVAFRIWFLTIKLDKRAIFNCIN